MDRFMAVPYVEEDGVRNFSDSFIRSLYDRMVADGTADVVFQDGTVRNSDHFLSEMKNGLTILFVLYVDGDPAAIVWLNTFEGKTARFHFCSFKNIWGQATVDLGHWVLRYILGMKDSAGANIFTTLIGIFPEHNQFALRFVKKMGVVVLGSIPGMCFNAATGLSDNGLVVYITQEMLKDEGL